MTDEQISKIFQNAPIAMAINNFTTFKFINVNLEFTRLTGFAKEDVIGKTPIEIGSWTDIETGYNLSKRLKQDGFIRMMPARVKKKNGEFTDGIYSAELIDYYGEECILAYSLDVSETKASKERYRELVEFMPMAMAVYDYNTKTILFRNQTAIRLMEENGESVIGRNALEFVDESSIEIAKKRMELLTKRGEVPPIHEKFKTCMGNIIDVEISSKLIKYKGVTASMVLFTDISEKMLLEEQLRQAAKLEAIGLLAGGVAHDFNNALSVIRGYSEMIIRKAKEINPPRTEHMNFFLDKIDLINTAAKQAETLTSQLLAFGRRQILQPAVFNINKFLNKERKFFRSVIREDVNIKYDIDKKLWNIKADTSKVQQALMNLLINSRDAIISGGTITIKTKNVSFSDEVVGNNSNYYIEPGEYARLSVRDDGIGMSEDIKQKIFEPFFTTKEKGIGLGLSTVYGIVKQSGGYIWVESELGKGTTFKLYFPKNSEKELREHDNGKEENNNSNLSGNETILVAEDQIAVKELLCEILKEKGYNVICSDDPEKVLQHAKTYSGRIDLLLTDVIMPKMNGNELAEKVVEAHPETKVLYVSGYTDNTIVHQGVLDPGTNFIQKPITPNKILYKVRAVLDNGGEGTFILLQ